MKKEKGAKKTAKKRVVFTYFAPDAKEVILMGDFNNWNPTIHIMKMDDKGTWKKILFLPKGRYEYKFLVDGRWMNDPKNNWMVENPFGTLNNIIST
jgi:1,4-alpha-glucan branching enzyme